MPRKKQTAPLYGPSDRRFGAEASRPIADLRGAIAGTAEQVECPARFDFDVSQAPRIFVTDLQTGRTARLPLAAYRDVRLVLAQLFPDED